MANEFDDPEMSYRRGYHQGAWAVFDLVDEYLPSSISAAVRAWIERDLHKWRLNSTRGESRRGGGRQPIAPNIIPPSPPSL
jgi:hypothetical protein